MMFREANGAVTFAVKVVPRASRNELSGIEGEVLRIRLTAPPVEGKANQALVKFLADFLDVGRSQIEIVSGEKSKHKMVRVRSLTAAQVKAMLISRP